jgi:proteasome lid subunit RPN8/RPN11
LSYVSIWKPVNDRIVEAAHDSRNETIGLLLGRLEDDTIIIDDSITGEYSAEPNRVVLPSHTLARIADDMVNGRLKGNIVGWYHSHTESGLSFSATDIQTQKKLQQFSSLIVGMVIDTVADSVGYYRVNPQTGEPARIPDEKIRIYTEPSAAVPPELIARPLATPTPAFEIRRRPMRFKQPTPKVIIAVIIIALAASLALIGALLYQGVPGQALTISHAPVMTATIGSPIQLKANVTGSVHSVALLYSTEGSDSFALADMGVSTPTQYSYTIPGEQVTGNILYYMEATDTSGNQMRSAMYQIEVADFKLVARRTTFTVYRSRSAVGRLNLLPINGFSEPVILTATGQPAGLSVVFSQNPVPPGATTVNVEVAADERAANGTFTLTLTSTYSPPNATSVIRQIEVTVTVADFSLQASPGSQTIKVGGTTTYLLTLTITQGFADRVAVSVQGLPSGASSILSTEGNTLQLGPGTTAITLQIVASSNVKPGTYTLTIIASGGGITHSQMVELTVR